ncbi:uncharacterized protein [Nerophis lumbriciformis]|uniref:uncharacterized protein n=1 Tax=Nerophis lumbriciformis TaxID=546530 RepID=UPI003BA84FFE
MDLIREYLWFWLILGMVFVCMLFGLLFIFINMCISKTEKYALDRKATKKENKYQGRNETATPVLPPRTQFLLAEAQNYENITERPDGGQNTQSPFQQNMDDPHDHDLNQKDPCERKQIDDNAFQDHDQYLAEDPDYEEIAEQQADYVKVVDEDDVYPPLMEDYDDIAGDDKDYDDLG